MDNAEHPYLVTVVITEPLLLSAEKAAELLGGISRSQFYRLSSAGKIGPLPHKRLGRTLWNRKELESWVDAGCPSRERWLETKAVGVS